MNTMNMEANDLFVNAAFNAALTTKCGVKGEGGGHSYAPT